MDINDTDESTLTDASRVTGRWKEPMDEEKRQNARVTEQEVAKIGTDKVRR